MSLLHIGRFFQADPAGGAGAGDPPTDAVPKTWEEIFKHTRFKELNTRAQTAESKLSELEKAEQKKTEDALKEQNKWQELHNAKEAELNKTKIDLLRLKTLTGKILPDEQKDLLKLVDRMRGDTEDEITKDVEELLAFIQPATKEKGNLRPIRNQNNNTVIDVQTETDPAKIREAYSKGDIKLGQTTQA